jgi:hypothetical protein
MDYSGPAGGMIVVAVASIHKLLTYVPYSTRHALLLKILLLTGPVSMFNLCMNWRQQVVTVCMNVYITYPKRQYYINTMSARRLRHSLLWSSSQYVCAMLRCSTRQTSKHDRLYKNRLDKVFSLSLRSDWYLFILSM